MYNIEFQRKVLKLLSSNVQFAVAHGPIVKSEYFEDSSLRVILDIIKDFVYTYNKEIDKGDLLTRIESYSVSHGFSTDQKKLILEEAKLVDKSYIKTEKYVVDELMSFCRRQEMKKALLKAYEVIKDDTENDGAYEQVVSMFDKAVSIGVAGNDGLTYNDMYDLPNRYKQSHDPSKMIKTGFPSYDNALMGGMAPSELHIFTAPPKSGKSTLASVLGANMLADGKNVFHVSLEIAAEDVALKYAAAMTGMSINEILTVSDEEYKRKIKKFDKYKPNLFINHWTEGTANTLDIRSWISKVRVEKNVSVDIIQIDYDDKLTHDTKIPLLDGTEPTIGELYESGRKEFWLYACKDDGEVVAGRGHSVRKYDASELVELELDNGEVVKSDPNHNHMLRDGTYKRADQFVVGDSMMPCYFKMTKDGYKKVLDNKSGKWEYVHRMVGLSVLRGQLAQCWSELKNNGSKRNEPAPYNHKVVAVRNVKLDEPVSVYCLSVDKYHNYALSAGIFTHNCLVPTGKQSDSMYENSSQIYSDMLRLASYFDCPVISFSQPKWESWSLPDKNELIQNFHLAHSSRKSHKAFSISSMNFPSESSHGILFLDINRRGSSKIRVPIYRDLGRCLITEVNE